jgi:signal transduction histidine kinase
MILQLDSFRTNQVVINLLSNALKFSKAFDTIHVKLQVSGREQSDDAELQIDVTDTGCGISADEQAKIFTPYFKSRNPDSLAKNAYGNGLGLSICQRIMTRLNGSITVKSKPGEGSTFTMSLFTKKFTDHPKSNNTVRLPNLNLLVV